jgi:hypothetical protein
MDISRPNDPIVDWQQDAPDWSRASCVDISPATADQLFFDGGADGAKLAKDFCVTCPLIELCLAYGQKTHSTGVWGGQELVEGILIVDGRRRPGRPPTPPSGLCGAKKHPFNEENIRIRADGYRECLPCRREGQARRTERKRAAREAAKLAA